jgi:serine protease Do
MTIRASCLHRTLRLVLLAASLSCAAAAAHESFAPALARVLPATAGVYSVGDGDLGMDDAVETPSDRPRAMQVGSGFFIGEGYLVTAAHVVARAQRVVVKLSDARVTTAQVVGSDPETDIAVLRLAHAPRLVDPPPWGRSAALRPGDWVVAVGEPFGLGRSVSAGIVGAKDRHFADDTEVLFIQSDLALNPGNSGGPLADARGAIVGMNLRTVVGPYGTAGVSLAVPIEIVLQIAQELRAQSDGRAVARPRLGADFHDLTPPQALERGRAYADGALIAAVDRGSLAERMGLRPDDIVVGLNGRAIASSADFTRALLAWRVALGTRVVVVRGDRLTELVMRRAE